MTNKTKNIILIITFFLTIILCYKLAISKTIVLTKQHKTLKQQDLLLKNTPKQISLLKQKQTYYDSILVKYQLNESSLQNNLLKTINTYSDSSNIKVISFVEPHTIKTNNLKVNNYLFTLEGNYNAILQLVYKLEQQTKFGEIVNLHFEKKKNFRTNKEYLQASILLRHLVKLDY